LDKVENPGLTDSEKVVQSKLIQIASKKTGASDAQKLQEALEVIRGLIK
jgi:hypothetical protein